MAEPNNVKSIFLAASEKPAAERAAFLDEAAGGDTVLRARIEALLKAHDNPDSFLKDAAAEFGATIDLSPAEHPLAERPGTLIGPYKLLEQIGEGGMGVVYMADQQAPVRRRVALKIIKAGMDTRQVIARFEAERQALALMDHSNIARVLDAGATESGRPYFVMELVRGIPITEYCDQNNLPVHDRLELFVQVCHAVQHAHQKGIIHRDLKPSNVLVTLNDGRAVPKVIDFGVAKATGQQLTEKTLFTAFAQMVGTPLYMSPEQAEMTSLDIDTRSDIYSLGVLLYELLTGTTPFDQERMRSAAFDEIRRIIREEEPPKPSTRLTTLAQQAASTVSAQRSIDPARLCTLVRGELDWIVMKCLEKDRNRRYESANSLAADISRYLNDEPVLACPSSAGYRLKKFMRRNYVSILPAAAMLLIVILGLAATTYLVAQERDAAREAAERERQAADQADRERQRAETNLRVAREAVDRLFTNVAQQLVNKPHMEQIRRALLVDALKFYQGFLQQRSTDPEMRRQTALAYWRVGEIHEMLGDGAQAEAALRESTAMLEKLVAEFPVEPSYRVDLASSRSRLAMRLYWAGKHENVEVRRQEFADWQSLAKDFPTVPFYQQKVAYAYTDMGNALRESLGQFSEAEQHYRQALAVWEKIRINFPNTPEDRWGLSHGHLWLGVLLSETTDQWQEAEKEIRQTVTLREQLVAEAPDAPNFKGDLAHSKYFLGDLLQRAGRPHEAAQYYQLAIDIQEKLRDDFPDEKEHQQRLGDGYYQLSKTFFTLGRTQEAEQSIRRSVDVRQKLVVDHPSVQPHPSNLSASLFELGLLLHATNRPEAAAEAFRQAHELVKALAREFPDVAGRQFDLAWFLATCPASQFRDPKGAVEAAQRALQLAPVTRKYWQTLGVAQYRTGDWQDAIEALKKSTELRGGGDAFDWFFLAMAHQQIGHKDEARQWYGKAIEWMDKNQPKNEELLRFRAEAAERLGISEPAKSTDAATQP